MADLAAGLTYLRQQEGALAGAVAGDRGGSADVADVASASESDRQNITEAEEAVVVRRRSQRLLEATRALACAAVQHKSSLIPEHVDRVFAALRIEQGDTLVDNAIAGLQSVNT